MALAERAYAREGGGAPPGPPGGTLRFGPSGRGPLTVNLWIIIINLAIFVLMALVPKIAGVFFEHGHFSTTNFLRLHVWRLVTFQFLHAGIMHVAFNMFGLWTFGPIVEQTLGPRRYLAFYLMCGIAGGMGYLLLNLAGYLAGNLGLPAIPGLLFNRPDTPLVGASAGVFGVIVAAAYIRPRDSVSLLFPPVDIPMKVFAFVYVGIALVSLLMGAKNAGGEAAHLGGAIAGYFFVRNSHLLRDFFDVLDDSRRAPRIPKPRKPPVSDEEVDRILAKVQREGMASLSEGERASLRKRTEFDRAHGGGG